MKDENDMQQPDELQQREAEFLEAKKQSERRMQAQPTSNGQELPSLQTPPSVIVLNYRGAEDTQQIVEVLAKRLVTRLWAVGDRLEFLDDNGRLVPVSTAVLRALISQHLATPRLVLRAGRYEVEVTSVDMPDHQRVIDVLNALTLKVAKAELQQKTLSPQLCSEVVSRVRMGEARVAVSKAYGISLDELKRIEQQAGPRW